MNIVVLLKQTFDTEEKIPLADGQIAADGMKYIINPYDEYALEQAIRTKEELGGKVTVVTAGADRSEEALRTALAMGADEAVRMADIDEDADESVIAAVLSKYLQSISYDLIWAGHFSVDAGGGQVALRTAYRLGIPHVSAIVSFQLQERLVLAERDSEGDTEKVKVQLPALFTAQQGLNEPRYPSLPNIMKAKKKPLTVITPQDLGIPDENLKPKTIVIERKLPASRQTGKRLEGELHEQVKQLIRLLREDQNLQI
ncbi:electron transfer flavoprotein subunit beta/FixA family protein [Marinicrinis lubricantis]|uniref:Electron transfer flavoprotein subunit beta n=1 Tax=Marinicrinis lubricantis TaxID=2086470 RepID=A0ABW1ILF2_9BACL